MRRKLSAYRIFGSELLGLPLMKKYFVEIKKLMADILTAQID